MDALMRRLGGSPMRDAGCLGCGAMVPERDRSTHAYVVSAAGCWEQYCSLEDWKAGLIGEQAIVTVQDLVDSHAVQHATNSDRRNRHSVAVHLMSPCVGTGVGSLRAAAAHPYRDLGRAGVPRL